MGNKDKEIPKGMIECPDCRGSGECVISCCTGDVIDDDWQLCPKCYEHCGEDTCETCGGTGMVDEDEEGSEHVDMQLRAENLSDLKRGI